jgi:hypothetical protein
LIEGAFGRKRAVRKAGEKIVCLDGTKVPVSEITSFDDGFAKFITEE